MAQTTKTAAPRAATSGPAAATAEPATTAVAGRPAAKKAPARRAAKKPAAKVAAVAAEPVDTVETPAGTDVPTLQVREGEEPWTWDELNEVRAELEAEESRLRGEIAIAEQDLAAMLRDGGDGAGDDQADAGSKTFEREQEMSLANNARDMLVQVGHAMHRIGDGTYGVCESCGNPIGKARVQAFPRATLCLTCKQREERR